ncbi:hypothetical protein ZRA01_35440 [Zoogloea ramigera]|uniref:PNPLA domain-containing protein n=1 Tax=Zoogloea ramigera TaxID=350 RepID=A0A4Y4CX34_ZOORA|nr:patatin-like phospholipase family protein [Zoogloea ramigera]GEC97471.1 hypothetical protein ZRA01_35440 [Zoogloea ramigera]
MTRMQTDASPEDSGKDLSVHDRELAWLLLTELRTRITTQELPLRDGVEETALQSVYDFFKLARESMGKRPGSGRCSAIVVEALNKDIRPFTAYWHGRKAAGRMGSVDERYEFRRQLKEVQGKLGTLADALSRLLGKPGALLPSESPATLEVRPVPFGIIPTAGMDEDTIRNMNEAEAGDVQRRRTHYELPNADTRDDAVGLALSGGGIRSSIFALGVVEVLARKGMLKDVDFMSTVSGGGYLGSFITTVLDDPDEDVTLSPEKGKRPFGAEGDHESTVVRHLRNHSKYLSEGGLQTVFRLGFVLLYGLFSSLLLVLPALMTGAMIVVALHDMLEALRPGWMWWIPLACVALVYAITRTRSTARGLEAAAGFLLAVTLVCGLLAALPELTRRVAGHEAALIAGTALLPFVLAATGIAIGPARIVGRVLLGSLVLAVPVFLIAVLLGCIAFLCFIATEYSLWCALGTTLLIVLLTCFVNLNATALHRYYRDRLARTYLVSGGSKGERQVETHDERPLAPKASAEKDCKGPVHLINAALNVPGSTAPDLRGRDSDFFLFSKHYCGSLLTGWHPTQDWQDLDPNLDLGTAMAISGAAASPHMGTLTSSRYMMLLAMLNIRLGYWVRRPHTYWADYWRFMRPFAPRYFLRELTGRMTEHTACVNVSDGGHIENLGIYELLRRRCRTIIAIDGECDPQHHFDGLLKLVRLAWIDLGVRIEPDLRDLRPDAAGLCNAHCIVTRLVYPDEQEGWLLYVKLSMTGNESEYLKEFRRAHPNFPHDSTAQQLFGEAQWEAYRALGEHVGRDLFSPSILGRQRPKCATEWVNRLAERLRA